MFFVLDVSNCNLGFGAYYLIHYSLTSGLNIQNADELIQNYFFSFSCLILASASLNSSDVLTPNHS